MDAVEVDEYGHVGAVGVHDAAPTGDRRDLSDGSVAKLHPAGETVDVAELTPSG